MEARNIDLTNITPFSGQPEETRELMSLITNGEALQKVGTNFVTAVKVQEHRSLSRVVANCLEEAELAGEDFYYFWTVKTREGGRAPIQGLSIGGSMCVVRNWGNCAVGTSPENENQTHFTVRGDFVDLETGFNLWRSFRQRKAQIAQSAKRMERDRAEDISYQIAQSKAARNVVNNAMPRWLINRMVEIAMKAVRKGIGENLEVSKAEAIKWFKSKGATLERMEAAMGKSSAEWTIEDVAQLKGMATALKEERVTIDELFPVIIEKELKARIENEEAKEDLTNQPVNKEFEQKEVPCPYCDHISPSERGMKKHITQSHKDQNSDSEVPNRDVDAISETESTELPESTSVEAHAAAARGLQPIADQIKDIMSELGNGATRLYQAALNKEGIETWTTATPLQQENVLNVMQRHLDERNQE